MSQNQSDITAMLANINNLLKTPQEEPKNNSGICIGQQGVMPQTAQNNTYGFPYNIPYNPQQMQNNPQQMQTNPQQMQNNQQQMQTPVVSNNNMTSQYSNMLAQQAMANNMASQYNNGSMLIQNNRIVQATLSDEEIIKQIRDILPNTTRLRMLANGMSNNGISQLIRGKILLYADETDFFVRLFSS